MHDIQVRAEGGVDSGVLMRDDALRLEVEFELADEIPGIDLAISITTRGGIRVLDEALSDNGHARLGTGRHVAQMNVPAMLNVGDFAVGVWFGTAHTTTLYKPAASSFTLHGSDRGRPGRIVVGNLPITVRRTSQNPGEAP